MGAILGVILLDETVVGVALPTIRAALHMSEVTAHWVVNVYMLVLAGLAAACGKLGDIVGRNALMISGLAIFGAASAASGLADGAAWLIAARGIQGLGAAIIFPTSLAMATLVFPPEKRGLAIGIYGAIGTTFLALGPLVGGFLTDFASWRFVFFVNPPIVLVVALVVLAAWRDPPRAGAPQPLDKTGLLLLVGGLSMTVFALMQGPVWGWRDPAILSLLIAGLVALTAFVFVELRKKAPLIAVRLFANPTFAGCNLVVFTAQYSKMAVFVFGALYLQDALKMSPFLAGLALLPTVAPQAALAPLAGRLADRYGARLPSILGVLGICVGLLAVGLAMARGSYALMFPGLLLWGLALPFVFMPPQRAVMNAVPAEEEGEAGGIVKSSQQLGATIGVAVCSTLYLMTGSFVVVFLAAAAVALAVFIVGWRTIEWPVARAA